MQIPDPAIAPGSTVVVIGANGFMAVEVCDKLLQAGYNVRGTVRDVKTHQEVRGKHNAFRSMNEHGQCFGGIRSLRTIELPQQAVHYQLTGFRDCIRSLTADGALDLSW
jgi:nucleoside-diphosphate-sugar epimerase